MKDSHVGAYGVIAIVLVLMLKFAALQQLAIYSFALALTTLVAAHVISRLLAASLIALAFAGLALARGVAVNGQTRIPFGPYLAFGFWLVWLYGPMTLGL